jgi:hypothetical protein
LKGNESHNLKIHKRLSHLKDAHVEDPHEKKGCLGSKYTEEIQGERERGAKLKKWSKNEPFSCIATMLLTYLWIMQRSESAMPATPSTSRKTSTCTPRGSESHNS